MVLTFYRNGLHLHQRHFYGNFRVIFLRILSYNTHDSDGLMNDLWLTHLHLIETLCMWLFTNARHFGHLPYIKTVKIFGVRDWYFLLLYFCEEGPHAFIYRSLKFLESLWFSLSFSNSSLLLLEDSNTACLSIN